MKIALINLAVDTNYGGNLQRFALYTVLKEMGHDVSYIPVKFRAYVPKGIKGLFIYIKRYLRKVVGRKKILVFEEKERIKEYAIQLPAVWNFIYKYLSVFPQIFYEDDDFQKLNESQFDAFIVGSDQVWRSSAGRNIEHYFLDFVKGDVLRIAYAASFGNDGSGYTDEQIEDCQQLIRKFDAVSLRESIGMDILSRYSWTLRKAPSIVLDPTLLLSKDKYIQLLDLKKNKERSLFYYILDINQEKQDLISDIARSLNLESKGIDTLFPNLGKKTLSINPSINSWLENIMNSEYVVTDSFHGTMFCLIFNVPFVTIINHKRGAERYSPLIDKLNLRGHFISDDEIDKVVITSILDDINWKHINSVIKEECDYSLDFLINSLKVKCSSI